MPGVFYLRSLSDLETLRDSLNKDLNSPQSLRFVVLGSSFIGVEIVSALKKIGVRDVVLVGRETVPFERVLGLRVGGAFKDLITKNGIRFIPHAAATEIIKVEGRVCGVRLSTGEVVGADRVVVGIGVTPEIPNIKGKKGIELANGGGIKVDPFLKTPSYPSIFAAGDIASFPYIKTGEEIRVEHFATAMDQGRAAAANMLNLNQPYKGLPFFWTMLFGRGLRYIGEGTGYDDVVIEGDLAKMQFVAYYTKGDKVIAAATMGKDPVCVAVGEAMRLNLMPTATELRLGLQNSQDILKKLKQAASSKSSS